MGRETARRAVGVSGARHRAPLFYAPFPPLRPRPPGALGGRIPLYFYVSLAYNYANA